MVFYLTLFRCAVFIGTPVRLPTTAPGCVKFGALFIMHRGDSLTPHWDVSVLARNFDDAPGRNICKAPVRYINTMHRAGVYGAYGVQCANVLCAFLPVIYLFI